MSLQASLLAFADGAADRLGLLRRPLQAEPLVALARRHSGLGEFGDTAFSDPLRRLLAACTDEASLSLVGRMATRWDVVRFLTNLLCLQEAEARDPGILRQPIDRPIFITGLPRSGTTFLHRLLLEDPDNRAPRVWQTIYPYPPRRGPRSAPGTRGTAVARLRAAGAGVPRRCIRWTPPRRRSAARSPRMCSAACASTRPTIFRATGAGWTRPATLPAYRFHRRFLQHLQHQAPGGRWVVKCPDHLFALDAIRAVYPDARLVFVHRDPVKVLLSVAKLTEVVRRPFTRRLDPHEIGRQESARWLEGTRRMMAVGDDAGLPEPIHHVHHKALVADPVGTVAALYRHFGLPLAPAWRPRSGNTPGERPRGGYGPRDYRFEDHGLDAATEREKFRGYTERFGIAA